MANFPFNFDTLRGYSHGTALNTEQTEAQGGPRLQIRRFANGKVRFNVGLSLSRVQKVQFVQFVQDHGFELNTFQLDSGNGVEDHSAFILPGSIQYNGSRDPIWQITMALEAPSIPAQLAPFDGQLVDLDNGGYGKNLDVLIARLAKFALEDLA